MEKNVLTRHVQQFFGVQKIFVNYFNLYLKVIHTVFESTKCGVYLDPFHQTSQASKSPDTLRTPTLLGYFVKKLGAEHSYVSVYFYVGGK